MRNRYPGWGKAAGEADFKPQVSKRFDSDRQRLRKVRLRLAGLIAGLLLALGSALPSAEPAQAQTVTTLVSNTGETANNTKQISASVGWLAQGFRTGSNPGSYVLRGIQVCVTNAGASEVAIVTLYEDDGSGNPAGSGTRVGRFIGPTDGTFHTYTPSADIPLDPNTQYFVEVTGSSGDTFNVCGTSSNAETSAASGFRNGAVDVKHRSSQRSGLARPFEHGAPSPAVGPLAGMVNMIDTGGQGKFVQAAGRRLSSGHGLCGSALLRGLRRGLAEHPVRSDGSGITVWAVRAVPSRFGGAPT